MVGYWNEDVLYINKDKEQVRSAESLEILTSTQFCNQILDLIAHKLLSTLQNAKKKIYCSAIYLENKYTLFL